jgi:hypothetical protein
MNGTLSALIFVAFVAFETWCIVSVWRITARISKYNAEASAHLRRAVAFLDESSQRTGEGEA